MTIRVNDAVKWRGTEPRQWHYGYVVSLTGREAVVEYTHSHPTGTQTPGRTLTLTLDVNRLRVL